MLSHSGAVNGFYALNLVVPSTRSAVILFSNLSSYSDINAVYNQLTALVLPKVEPTPAPAPAAQGQAAAAGRRRRASRPSPGRPAADQARAFVRALQAGRVDRRGLGEEFDVFLKDAFIAPGRGPAEGLRRAGGSGRRIDRRTRRHGGLDDPAGCSRPGS